MFLKAQMACAKVLESLACWLSSVIPAFGMWRQQKFKVKLTNPVEFEVSLD